MEILDYCSIYTVKKDLLNETKSKKQTKKKLIIIICN